jgi:hypothetical protein
MESVVSFLGSGSIIFRCMLLEKLQEPLGYYLRDVAGHFKVEGGCEKRMLIAVSAQREYMILTNSY